MFGLGHTTCIVPTEGTLVSRRLDRAGADWMAPVVEPKSWTGAATWDTLVRRIGGP